MRAGLELGDVVAGGRLLRGLPRALRRPFDLTEARRVLQYRLETRDARFLALLRRAVYAVDTSPYRALLVGVGCEYGDLERLVQHEGVEGALALLCRQGVRQSTASAPGGHRGLQRAGPRAGIISAVRGPHVTREAAWRS